MFARSICLLVVVLGRVVPGCVLVSGVAILVPVSVLVGSGAVVTCPAVVIVTVVHFQMFAVCGRVASQGCCFVE